MAGATVALLAVGLGLVTVPAQATAAPAAPAPAAPAENKVDAELTRSFQEAAGEPQDFWVSFEQTADTSGARQIGDWAERGAYVVERLRQAARDAQADTIRMLDQARVRYTSYWIANAIRVEGGDHTLAQRLAAETEVARVFAPVGYSLPEPVDQQPTDSKLGPDATVTAEWGVANVRADQAWDRYGIRGDGIVVANIDSGVQFDHPALVEAYRGNNGDGTFTNDYNWFDPATATPYPTDGNGHGTHTMGTMIGDDRAANKIGVAPGATWIAARGCEGRTCSDASLLAVSQWMLAPTRTNGSGADPAKRPHIINNSWGADASTDPFLEDIQLAWADAGMFGVWSNGNSGPGCNTSGSPGSRVINYSVGAYDSANTIANFSSRGPGQDGEIKPNIAAPGVDVRSAWPTSQYAVANGTSMAAPHVSGAVALLLSADPGVIGDVTAIRQRLDDTAVDTANDQCGGTADDNNVFGEGRLDALALVDTTDQPETGTITGTVSHDESGDPVAGATIRLVSGDVRRSTQSGADGTYAASIPAGTYQASVRAFGYQDTTVTIEVTAGQTTTTDIRMPARPGHTITGTVADERTGQPIPQAIVSVPGSRFTASTANDGRFTLPNIPGPATYVVSVNGGPCAPIQQRTVRVEGDTDLGTISLSRHLDQPIAPRGLSYGYGCVREPSQWIEGDHVLPRHEDWLDLLETQIPFDFPFFGQTYRSLYLTQDGLVSLWPINIRNGLDGNFRTSLRLFNSFNLALVYAPESAIRTRTTGQAPNRVFTVEYHRMGVRNWDELRLSFQVHLGENGDIVYAYRGLENSGLPRDAWPQMGIQSPHSDGASFDGQSFNDLYYAREKQILPADGVQIRFDLPDNGFVKGVVRDHSTGSPVAGATVDVTNQFGRRVVRTHTKEDGRYTVQLRTGLSYQVAIHKPDGYPESSTTTVPITTDGQIESFNATLRSGRIETDAETLTLARGKTEQLRIRNRGSADLSWRTAGVLPNANRPQPGTELSSTVLNGAWAFAVEEVNGSWWAGGLNFSQPGTSGVLQEFTPSGQPTGRRIDVIDLAEAIGADPLTFTPGDLAWIPSSNRLCVAFLQPTNDIACVTLPTGRIDVIRTGVPAEMWVDGLAYDPVEDLLYVSTGARDGGVYEQHVTALAGFEHADPGARVHHCTVARESEGGLAFHPTTRTLWTVTTRVEQFARVSVLQEFDPRTCAEQSHVAVARQVSAGLSLDRDGNFLAVSPLAGVVARIQGTDPVAPPLDWLNVSQLSGSLAPNKSQRIQVSVDWEQVPPGVTEAHLVIRGNGGAQPEVTIPIVLRR